MDLDVFAGILTFYGKSSAASAASAAIAAAALVVFTFLVAVTATALVVFTFAVAATALVVFTFTVVVTALMAFAVVMMIAVCACVHKLTTQICSYCLICIAGSTCADFDACVGKRVQCAAAKAAADQNLDIMVCQKSCQCAVADSIRSNDFTGYDAKCWKILPFSYVVAIFIVISFLLDFVNICC